MFHNFAEDIAFLLITKKKADIEKREIYIYGLEVFLLNAGLLLIFFIISVLAGSWEHFLSFLIFFVPLRMFAGGYHAKTSGRCFLLSVAMYVVSLEIVRYLPLLYKSPYAVVFVLICAIIIFVFAPLINPNNELSEWQIKRNRIVVRAMLGVDLVLFIACYWLGYSAVSSGIVFVGLIAGLLLAQKALNFATGFARTDAVRKRVKREGCGK